MILHMAIYHCSIKIGSRSNGRSAVASSAYRSGQALTSNETGITHDYTKKSGIVWSTVMTPRWAPKEYDDRATLWNAVEKVEKNKNAQLFREIEVALPRELTREEQIDCVDEYVYLQFVDQGMCADVAIHDKGDGNPHAHIMLTTRGIDLNGNWEKKEKKVYKLDEKGEKVPIIDKKTGKQKIGKNNRKMWERVTVQTNDWNNKENAVIWRKAWADVCNQYLEKEKQIDYRSYATQGKEEIPTIHEGYMARKIEKNGGVSERCEINRQIRNKNTLIRKLINEIKDITHQIAELTRQKGDQFNERFARLMQRRTTTQSGRATSGGERKTERRESEYGNTDINAFIANLDAQREIAERNRRRSETERKARNNERKRQDRERERTFEKAQQQSEERESSSRNKSREYDREL